MGRTLPVVIIVALAAVALWYFQTRPDDSDTSPADSASTIDETSSVEPADPETSVVAGRDESPSLDQPDPVTPSTGTTTVEPDSSAVASDSERRPATDAATATAGHGAEATEQQIVETPTEGNPALARTEPGGSSVTLAQGGYQAPDSGTAGHDVPDPAEDGRVASAATPPALGSGNASADAISDLSAKFEAGAQQIVETLTQPSPPPIPAGRADPSVTQEQVVSVVPDDTVERVTIREPAGDDAVELDATVPAEGDQPVSPAPPRGAGEQLANTLAAVAADVEAGAQQIVETLAQPPPPPIPASRADPSVTQEQVVSVVPDDTVERVTIREPAGDDAFGLATTDPAEPDQPVSSALPRDAGEQLANTLAAVAADVEAGAQQIVETLTQPPPPPIPAGRADPSVTQEQVVSVVPDDTIERVTIREPAGDDAFGLATTDPAEPDQPVSPALPRDAGEQLANTLAAVAADVEAGAQQIVETLTQPPSPPIPAGRADSSVTQEQVVSVVPDDTIERVTIREPAGDDAFGLDTTDPAEPDQPVSSAPPRGAGEQLANTLAAVAADVGATVERIVEALTEPSAPPIPTDRADPSATEVEVIPPVPTDHAGSSATGTHAIPPVPDDAVEREAVPGPADDIEAEAQRFVETLTEPAPQPIPADRADHFVTQEQVISLVPEDIIERVTIRELADDGVIGGDTPITVVRETEQIEGVTQEQLIAESGGDVEKPVRVPLASGESVAQTTIGDVLTDMVLEPGRLIPVVRTVRTFEVTTLNDLLDDEVDMDSLLGIIKQPYRIEAATLAELLQRQMAENPDSIFYLHTVLPSDDQGIWGIVHFGLIDNFARGVAIRRGENVETYTVHIPRDADERLEDHSSSFLGRLIDRKTKESYVYNFREHRMGRNPDRIFPGQELVIINFKAQELVAIYKQFASG